MNWFPFTGMFHRKRWSRWHWNVVSKYIRSGYHGVFNNFLIPLLIITFTRQFVYFLMFSRHLCPYKSLLLNDWSTPIITICCLSHSDCNRSLWITHCWSNESMSGILSITLVDTRDSSRCSAWSLLPSYWEQKGFFW